MMSVVLNCPLCQGEKGTNIVTLQERRFFRCFNCDLLSLDPNQRLSLSEEKARYESHNNDVKDPKYQEFVSPLVDWICEKVPAHAHGLDFGAGTGPILANQLKTRGYEMDVYDPFFWPDSTKLEGQYDFVVASEVVEHFANPQKEFELLKKLIKPGGVLGLMTLLHDSETEIASWYYLKDPTHISAYSTKTFEWIQSEFFFSGLEIRLPRSVILFCPLGLETL